MDKRSLLIGLGIGIIIGALLTQLFKIGEQSTNQLNNFEQSTQIEADQNLVSQDYAAMQGTNNSPEEPIQNHATSEISGAMGESDELEAGTEHKSPSTDEDYTNEQPGSVIDETSEQANNSSSEQALNNYILRVVSGASLTETAEQLFNYNIISDVNTFISLMKETETAIRAGFFLVEENSSDEQVRRLLSGIPMKEEEAMQLKDKNNLEIIYSPEIAG